MREKQARSTPDVRSNFPKPINDLPERKPAANVISMSKARVQALDLTDAQWDRIYEFSKTI